MSEIPDIPDDPPSDPALGPPVEIPGAPGWVQELFNRLDEREEIRRRTYTDKANTLSSLVRELIKIMRKLDVSISITKNEGRGRARRLTEVGVQVDNLERRLGELEDRVNSLDGGPSDAPPTPTAA